MKRATPWIAVGVMTLLVALTAFGVNQVIRRFTAVEGGGAPAVTRAGGASQPVSTPVNSAPSAVLSKRQYIDGILARNIFDSASIGKEAEASVTDTTLTDLDLRLIGTLVASPESYSVAYISPDEDDAEAGSYAIGDMIEDATITAIAVDQVTLRRGDDSIETLSMSDEEPAPRRPAARSNDDEGEEGIDKVDDNHYVIDRSLVDQYMTDLDAVSRLGRAIPHRGSDGEIDGYRLSGIRRRSMGDQIGIKNGDIVHSVNGQDLTSMQGAMAAYQTLQTEGRFTFEITRRGQRQTMTYEVQ